MKGVKTMWSPHHFLAIPLDSFTKNELYTQTTPFQQEGYFSKWVHRSDYHLTLLFLGEVDNEIRSSFLDKVQKVINEFPPFSLVMDPFGVFGPQDSPRIFWSGVQKSD